MYINKLNSISVCFTSGFIVGELGQGASLKVKERGDGKDRLMTICYRGQRREIYRLWVNPRVRIYIVQSNIIKGKERKKYRSEM